MGRKGGTAAPPPDGPYPEDRRNNWFWPAAWFVAGLAAYGVSLLLAARPGLALSYGSGLGPALARPLSRLTGLVPFSVGDLLIGGYAVSLAALGLRAVRSALGRRRRWRNVFAGGARRVVTDAGAIAALFYLLWGWNYAVPGFEAAAGWPEPDPPDREELIALVESATAAANDAYVDLHGMPDVGRPTRDSDAAEDVDAALDEGWRRTTSHLGLPAHFGAKYGRTKRPLGSAILVRLGIRGIYFPLTAEANVIRGMPPVGSLPAMGHEQAHQRGITSEGEAGFLGLIAAALAPGKLARYGAAVAIQGRLAAALAQVDREEWSRMRGSRLPGVTRDLMDYAEFMQRVSAAGSRVQAAVNDRYLRANRVPGGTANYAVATRLLITYARLHGGVPVPGR